MGVDDVDSNLGHSHLAEGGGEEEAYLRGNLPPRWGFLLLLNKKKRSTLPTGRITGDSRQG